MQQTTVDKQTDSGQTGRVRRGWQKRRKRQYVIKGTDKRGMVNNKERKGK